MSASVCVCWLVVLQKFWEGVLQGMLTLYYLGYYTVQEIFIIMIILMTEIERRQRL